MKLRHIAVAASTVGTLALAHVVTTAAAADTATAAMAAASASAGSACGTSDGTARLASGRTLAPGQNVRSARGTTSFGLDRDGVLAIRTASGAALWKKGAADVSTRLVVSSGGELLLRGTSSVRWRSGVSAECLAVHVLDDGRVVAARGATEVWSIPAGRAKGASVLPRAQQCATPRGDRLIAGEGFAAGRAIVSPTGSHRLHLDDRGLLTIRDSRGVASWKQGPAGAGSSVVLQRGGNLVLRDAAGRTVWQNGRSAACSTLRISDDGRLVQSTASGEVWSVPSNAAPAPAPSPSPSVSPTRSASAPAATASAAPTATAAPSGSRVAADQPFSTQSPWNRPVTSSIAFVGTNDTRSRQLAGGNPAMNSSRWSVAVYRATSSDPMATINDPQHGKQYRARVPRSTQPAEGTDRHVVVIQPDGRTAYEFYKFAADGTDRWTSTRVVVTDLHSDGLADGARASSTSVLGGLVRAWELDAGKIQHSLAVGIPNSMLKSGPVWPARTEDRDAATAYGGSIPMGTMLAIPRNVDIDSLGLSPEGRAIGRALQDYGAYVLIRSDTVAIFCELDCDPARAEAAHNDWRKVLFPLVRIVSNSSANGISGGGTPVTQGPGDLVR